LKLGAEVPWFQGLLVGVIIAIVSPLIVTATFLVMNLYRGGYMLESERDRRIIPACNECVKELSNRNESFRIK
jgi:hypothetical protein